MSKKKEKKDIKIFVAPDGGSQPKIFAIPQEFRFPVFFIDFPLLRSGIRHLVEGKEIRYSDNGEIVTAVKNPLSPASLKLLMLLMAQKEQQVYMKVRDVMKVVSGDEKNSSKIFDIFISKIQDSRLSITFYEEEHIPKELKPFLSTVKLKSGYKKRIRDVVIISSVADLIREERKARDTKINFSQEFIAVCNSAKSGYAKVKTSILEQLSNKHSEELLVYLLCLKMQKKHLRDYLTLYLLNCSQRFLIEKVKKERVDVVRESIRRIFKRSLEALQKLKELNVIKDFSYEEGRLSVGDGGRTVPFFESLTLIKPHSAEKTE
jgi:hypothetical protein